MSRNIICYIKYNMSSQLTLVEPWSEADKYVAKRTTTTILNTGKKQKKSLKTALCMIFFYFLMIL